MRRLVVLGLALSGSALLPAEASAQFSRTGAPSVTFTATGPAGVQIEGKTNDLDVAE